MSALPSLLVVSMLQGASPAPTAFDLASGSLSYLVSKGCHGIRKGDEDYMEWPALTYAAGRAPMWGTTKFKKCYPDLWTVSEALGAGALWSLGNHEEIEATPLQSMFDQVKTYAAFKKVFGWDLVNHGTIAVNGFIKYDARKLKRMFDLVYMKPGDAFGSATAQQVYDRVFKDFIARFARDAAYLKTAVPKAKLGTLVKDYQATAKAKGNGFNGTEYLHELALKEIPQDQEPETARSGRTLGIVLRRTADGTWPTIVTLLKKVLADYDPELSTEIGAKL